MVNKTIDIIDRAGGWLLYQVDNNDYLAGFIAGLCFVSIPYLFGIIDIVMR